MANTHAIKKVGLDHFRLSWWVDRKVKGSRLRFPRGYTRDTDTAGAERFAKKWGCTMPVEKTEPNTLDEQSIGEIVGS